MNLQELAQATINIEFPGMTLHEAATVAADRTLSFFREMSALEAKLLSLKYQLDEVTDAFHSSRRACSLFENAIDEERQSCAQC